MALTVQREISNNLHAIDDNDHRSNTIVSVCGGILAGSHSLVNLYTHGNDCYTGWHPDTAALLS